MHSQEKYLGLGEVPVGIGAVIKGWNINEDHFRNPDNTAVVDFRAMTNACPHDCFHCYTDKNKRTLILPEIKSVIDQAAQMGAVSINFLGEGEPTIDKDFFAIVEHTKKQGIQPVIFTDGAARLRDREFVKRLNTCGASIVLKCDSLYSPEYQNWVVGDKSGKYFHERNEALQLLIQEGFNESSQDGTTRLGFDMVVTKRNMEEVGKTLRFCREKNLWIVFTFFLPSGRSAKEDFDKSLELTEEEKKQLASEVQRIDGEEFGFSHPVFNNFLTSPCIEGIQIYGDGRVSPCPGNETVIGNIRELTLKEIRDIMLKDFPDHDPCRFDGNCLYRPKITF